MASRQDEEFSVRAGQIVGQAHVKRAECKADNTNSSQASSFLQEILNRDHGFPLRVVVPGVIGARSVKWLDSINLLAEECQGFFMQKDYKMFPPSVNWDNINWSSRRPQMDFPVQSAICSLEDVQMVRPGKVSIKGYAVSGGGRGIERVDISMDGGKSWVEASRTQKPGRDYISEHNSSDK
ncbi:hypothetical protein F2Q69_00026787 [Brassica cretica]|uniref:Moybdenum cofactor oxidoreductase dimerisation domain-containing protein n=1 Tax=Brassica cretica TaxID=69181 RepID=A0A8S9RUG8_BRACR|nr:hypothetical protein F2Q69_00026787 [Brassica cretica]